jgi:hypothetical protein
MEASAKPKEENAMKRGFALSAGLSLLSVLPISTGAARAAGFPGPDLHPLLKVHEQRLDSAGPIPPIFLTDDDLLLTRGGGFSLLAVSGDTFTGPYQTTIAQGVASPAAFTGLAQALEQVHIGTRNDTCRMAFPQPVCIRVLYIFSWYGRGARHSRITVSDDPALPDECPEDLRTLIQAFIDFKTQVLADPATRIYSSGP